MIALKNVIKRHVTFEKISLNHTYYFFKYIKNIDITLLNINKILCFSVLDMIVEFVFQVENEHYLQIHINECEYE